MSAEEKERAVGQLDAASLDRLLSGEQDAIVAAGDLRVFAAVTPEAVLPGAFNPLHQAHRQMASYAAKQLRAEVAFELSLLNVDKAALDLRAAISRVAQFEAPDRIWLTRSATFVEKARRFPGSTFVVGADTIQRIADCRYYGSSVQRRDKAIAEVVQAGCSFLVFGRRIEGRFRTLEQLQLPGALARICRQVNEESFRLDVSSTELRQSRRGRQD